MNISPRVKNIIQILCKQSNYITIDMIAQELQVSSRTILRELQAVEKWLRINGYRLEKKKGTGIRLDVGKWQEKEILNLLEEEKVKKVFSPEERQAIILSELIFNGKVIKMYYFTRLFDITEGTIGSDLDKIEEWLGKYDLTLVRKRGLGVYIDGEEKKIRRAGKDLIYEYVDETYILNLIRSKIHNNSQRNRSKPTVQSKILEFIDYQVITLLEDFMAQIQEQLGYRLADDAYVALMVHMAIALSRITKNQSLWMETKMFQKIQGSNEYKIVSELLQPIRQELKIEFSESEIGYIAVFLKGSKGKAALSYTDHSMIEDFKLIKIAKEMIYVAEIEMGYYLEQNEKLLIGLVRHLGPAINKIKLNLDIRNPLLKEIKQFYPHIFQTATQCAKILEEHEKIEVPEEEIAYIAMHLGAAMEHRRKDRRTRDYRIVVACSSGIGTSRMLSSRIEREFPYVQIIDNISTLNICGKDLQEQGVDLIVSTVQIPSCGLPVIVVNPLLNQHNKQELEKFFANYEKSNGKSMHSKKKNLTLKEKLDILNTCSEKILQVLNNFQLIQNVDIQGVNEAILFVGELISQSEQTRNQLYQDLKNREKQGSTLLEQKEIMLLHCRTSTIHSLYFKVIRPNKCFYIKDWDEKRKKVGIIAVMLAPRDAKKVDLEILSEITKELMENEGFTHLIRENGQQEIYHELSEILERFYLHKSLKTN